MLFLKIVTPPTGYVVSLEEAKAQARIDGYEEDQLILAYIQTATSVAEMITGQKFLTQVWDWFLDDFPCAELTVPLGPLVSVDSIKYYDTSNVQQTWSSANYEIDPAGLRPRICPVSGVSWPDTYSRLGAVTVRMTVGYGAASAVPQAVKHWVMAATAEAMKNREITIERNTEVLSGFMNGLLDPYTVPTLQ